MSIIKENEANQTYLGDGLYACWDGFHIWLRAERSEGVHEIALDIDTLNSFKIFLESLRRSLEEQDQNKIV